MSRSKKLVTVAGAAAALAVGGYGLAAVPDQNGAPVSGGVQHVANGDSASAYASAPETWGRRWPIGR